MNDNNKLDNLMKETTEQLKLGKFNDIIKVFKEHYNEDDPSFIVIMKTIADAKMVKRDFSGAYDLYVKVYNVLRTPDKLGPEHSDVLSIMLDCARTSRSIITAIGLFDQVDEISNRTNEVEIIDKSMKLRKVVIDELSPVNRRVYKRMLSKVTTQTVTKTRKESHPHLTKTQLDELMNTFSLE